LASVLEGLGNKDKEAMTVEITQDGRLGYHKVDTPASTQISLHEQPNLEKMPNKITKNKRK
jgi:hypothetical protein